MDDRPKFGNLQLSLLIIREVKIPCLTVSTNVSLDGVDTSSVLSQLISAVAKIMARPHSYVMAALEGSIPTCFGGTEEPAAFGELVSMGALNPELNNKLTAEIASILETNLSVPKSRFFLKFYDIQGYNCGLNGSIMVIQPK
ncbi:macrophage migration inhibitory factor homolog [Cajanus cajan]|uniref:macrophage migration inhibitory factor homolog n=1 Tax=Cajanus cajan TaxID=3821 RepID=UPI00098D841B|nr:macrophage migration inhibitory factor homolog [Cajanus cajan]